MNESFSSTRRQFAASAAAAALTSLIPLPTELRRTTGLQSRSRHTLPPQEASFVLPPGEPKHTILHQKWRAARARAEGLLLDERGSFMALLDSVESAWPHVRVLQHLHDRLSPAAEGALASLLEFIDMNICDIFRDIVDRLVVFVPDVSGALIGEPDFDNTNAEAGHFGVLVAVLRSATFDPEIPADVAAAVRHSTEALRTWYAELEPSLTLAAAAVEGL